MVQAYGLQGISNVQPAAIIGSGVPSTSFKAALGQQYFDKTTSPWTEYVYNGTTWVLTETSGGLVGTANQVTVTSSGGVSTLSTPATFIAPGSVSAAVGDITATNGNIVITAAGKGFVTNPTVTTAGASPLTCNGRIGQVTFSGVSIASGATQSFEIDNSAITGSGTIVHVSFSGVTTGAALTLDSITPAAGKVTIVVGNCTSATEVTSVANITFVFQVLN